MLHTYQDGDALGDIMTNPTAVRERVSPEEWQIRVELAACYRLVALYGWDDVVFTHISGRVRGGRSITSSSTPCGHLFEEISRALGRAR